LAEQWAIWFAIEGDLRFCSHHDLMRVVERLGARARLPLRYSQGYNPRPQLSLACPRPVGVAVREDLLVAAMDSPDEAGPQTAGLREADLLEALNRQAPRGLWFLRARAMNRRTPPRPMRIEYELTLTPAQQGPVRAHLEQLAGRDGWPVERLVSGSSRHGPLWRQQEVNIKPLIEQVELAGTRLVWTARRQGDAWARPGELLALVGLDSRVDLARVARTNVVYEHDPLAPPPRSAPESPADPSAAGKGNEQRDFD
jgi:radical SAM-linked protein